MNKSHGGVGLVLSRATNQQIKIGEDITITIVRANRGHARIGIRAPEGVNIARTELLDDDGQYKSERRAA